MKRFCLLLLLLLCLPLIFTVNNLNAHMRALAAIPNPVAGAQVQAGYHRHVTEVFDSAGKSIDLKKAGIFLIVNSAVVADGYGQIAMLTYGTLNKDGKKVQSLSEGHEIKKIGYNTIIGHLHQIEIVRCKAFGLYIAGSKAETGNFTLNGKSVFTSTSSRQKITVNIKAASFEGGGGKSELKTREPMFDDYSFSIDYIDKYKCSACGKDLPKDTKEKCTATPDGKHSFQNENDGNNGNGGSNGNDNDDDDSEEQGNADPTVPDRPGSFELTPYKVAIKLRWTDADDGGSPITDYQYQKQSSRSNRKHWSSWSDWISAGTGNSTWLTGLSKGVDYAVRMRAVNAVGNSIKTGIKIVKTKE